MSVSSGESRRGRRADEIARFLRQYGRKAQKQNDPNDRQYDRGVERRVRRMAPVELDRLMRDDG